ncbi:MAG: hypothetical protein IJL38_06065 [Bacteroidales bacterium]|nr:hypothetical protein [Bacteroidales bacterium]
MKMKNAVKELNARMPMRGNDWMWKDSVAYDADNRIISQYFSYHVEGARENLFRHLYREIDKDTALMRILMGTENNSIWIENNVSVRYVGKFPDGEVLYDMTYSPKELKDIVEHPFSSKEITEKIYMNQAVSLNAVTPIQLSDGYIVIKRAEFKPNNSELTIYWDVDNELMQYASVQDLEEYMEDYITLLVQYNHQQLLDLEKAGNSMYKRTVYPVRVTLISHLSGKRQIKVSKLTTEVINN